MSQNVWEILLDILEDCSCKQIFGIFGDAINPLADALRHDNGKRFEWVGVRHEEVAAFAAGAQAKLTGKLGLCAGTVGPGAIHLLNGLYDAKMDHAPVLAMTGQVPRAEIGTDYHQEVNLDRLFDDVCVYNQTVIIPQQMPRLGLLAAQTALARNSVAHLSIPTDVGPEKALKESLEHPVFIQQSKVIPTFPELQRLADTLNHSQRTTILVGWGARGGSNQVLALAEILQAPVVHALKGKVVISNQSPYWAGGIGMLGSTCGMEAMEHCDVLLMLGSDFPYQQFYPKGKEIIQINTAAEHLGKRAGIKQGLVGDVTETLKLLIPLLKNHTHDAFLKQIQKKRAEWEALCLKRATRTAKKVAHPQAVAYAINKYAQDNTIFTADTGEVIIWMAQFIEMRGHREFIASFNHATMANALPQAIGLQFLDKKRQVIAMCGDGGFSMLMGDLITAVTHQLPIKIIIFNNGVLGLVKMEMESTGFPEWGIRLHNPNFADCAKAMGAQGIRVENPADVDAAIKRALSMDGPVVVDVLTNPDELVVPPKIKPANVWGFSVSKMKELWAVKE